MPTALFTKQCKISLAVAFVLAWPATWIADVVCFTSQSIPVFSGRVQTDGQGNESYIRLPTSPSPGYMSGIVQLNVVTESSGWPFTTTFHRGDTVLMPEELWSIHIPHNRLQSTWGRSSEYVSFEQTILASDDQRAINAITGVFPPTGPRFLGWMGNVAVWWILSYLGITVTLTIARSTYKAAHIPKELVQQNRASHGLCPRCGYDIRALDKNQLCPECGKKPSEIAVTEAKKNPIDDEETDKDDAANVSCE